MSKSKTLQALESALELPRGAYGRSHQEVSSPSDAITKHERFMMALFVYKLMARMPPGQIEEAVAGVRELAKSDGPPSSQGLYDYARDVVARICNVRSS